MEMVSKRTFLPRGMLEPKPSQDMATALERIQALVAIVLPSAPQPARRAQVTKCWEGSAQLNLLWRTPPSTGLQHPEDAFEQRRLSAQGRPRLRFPGGSGFSIPNEVDPKALHRTGAKVQLRRSSDEIASAKSRPNRMK